jgi:restriction system protein
MTIHFAAAITPSTAADKPLDVFIELMVSMWPFWLLAGAVGLLRLSYGLCADHRADRARRARNAEVARKQEAERARLERSGIAEIDAMEGRMFEHYLETLFTRLGYHVESTQYRGDYGADLVIERDGFRVAVQAKRYSKPVGLRAVQEVLGSKGTYRCDAAMVVSNQAYTPQARRLAADNDVELWDRERLVEKLLAGQDAATQAAPKPPMTVAQPTPKADTWTCATCGAAVSARVRSYCLDQPERFGSLVYCFKHQRSMRPLRQTS